MWFFLALGSALIYAFKGILEKRIIANINNYVLAFAVRVFALPFFFLPFFFNKNLLHVNFASWNFWLPALIVSFINTPFESYFYYKALESEEATLVLPILTLGPALTVLWGSFFLKEIPSFEGIIGVLCIVFGIYALKLSHAKEGIFEPFHHIRKNTAIRFMALVTVSSSIAGILDKVAIVASNAYIYGLINYAFVSLSLLFIALFKAKGHMHQVITHKGSLFIIGAVIASYTLLNFVALETGFAGYVGTVRASYILFALVMGIIFLKEKEGKQKFLAGVFIVIGLILIKLFS